MPLRQDKSLDKILEEINAQYGLQLQRNRPIRAEDEVILACIEAIQNDAGYEPKPLLLLYASARKYLSEETRAKIDEAMKEVKNAFPTFHTEIRRIHDMEVLSVNQGRADDERSSLPIESPEHYRIWRESEGEYTRYQAFIILSPVYGLVIHDLVEQKVIPKQFATEHRAFLPTLKQKDNAQPQ